MFVYWKKNVFFLLQKRLENNITPSFPSSDTYVNLRNSLSDAKAKMHTHRVIMDRHLPLNLAPLPPVEPEVDRMFNELADRYRSILWLSGLVSAGQR